MRADLGDAMDDTFSEDTLMECGQGYEEDNLVQLPNRTNDNIRGTVEKLLTLLESNDDEDEVLSCSEDEGVEADLSESEECLEETGNLKVLYQLALLLTEELKCPRTEDYPVVSDSSSLLDRINDDPMDRLSSQEEASDCTWTAGWDACSSEALRYLVEVEGLPVHHPTVLAMTSHLQSQRDRLLFKT